MTASSPMSPLPGLRDDETIEMPRCSEPLPAGFAVFRFLRLPGQGYSCRRLLVGPACFRCVPNLDQSFIASRCQLPAARAEGHTRNTARVRLDCHRFLADGCIPNPQRT